MYISRQHPVLGSNLLTEIETSWMNRNAEVSFLKDPVNDHSVFLPSPSLSDISSTYLHTICIICT